MFNLHYLAQLYIHYMHVTINKILTNTRLSTSILWHTCKNSLKIQNLLHLTTVNQLFFLAGKFCNLSIFYIFYIFFEAYTNFKKKKLQEKWRNMMAIMFQKHLDRHFVLTNYVNFWPRLSARHRNLLRNKVGTDGGPRLRMVFFLLKMAL